jgi:probable HAF family extracellular repeat protein
VTGLNNFGQVSGNSDLAGDDAQHPFTWRSGSMLDLGTLGGRSAFSSWIDESGRVVGGSFTSENFRAFSWQNGKMRNLGSLNSDSDVCSIAFNSNSKGQIVGNSLPLCEDDPHPFLWENGGPMIDLNIFVPPGSGILLREAYFINEGGMIAVTGQIAGVDRAFVLVPVAESTDSSAGEAQASPQVAQSAPTVTQVPVSPEAIAAFAARYAHRSRGLQRKRPK